MTHYPSHKRTAFQELMDEWAPKGELPPTTTLEVDYEPQRIPTGDFLQDFLGCDDQLPKEYREMFGDGAEVYTYAQAAHVLLEEYRPRYHLLAGTEHYEGLAGAVVREIRSIDHARETIAKAKRQKKAPRLGWVHDPAANATYRERLRKYAAMDEDRVLAVANGLAEDRLDWQVYGVEIRAIVVVHDGDKHVADIEVQGDAYPDRDWIEALIGDSLDVSDVTLQPEKPATS